MKGPVAHIRSEDGAEHDLAEHLRAVAERARRFADVFGAAPQAELAGLWHDLGKYAEDFQSMIRSAQRAEAASAHLESEHEMATTKRVDHSTAGAFRAFTRDSRNGLPIAFAIAGHHAGLADLKAGLRARFEDRGRGRLDAALSMKPPHEILDRPVPPLPAALQPSSKPGSEAKRRLELFTRMIFSALCDADFLDTEAFFDADRVSLRRGHRSLADLAERLRSHVDTLTREDTEVNRVRTEVRRACQGAIAQPPGIFTLTVPTGGGKTFAAMELALGHALCNGLERVVVAIPYTSIIEQNAARYRDAFGLAREDASLVEHHSALDPARESPKNRVSCENWDAPIVVTTNVQLLESLLANRPSACRKLHNLSRAVIVLDEAQTLPRGLLAPTTDVLESLVRDYGASIVLSTATQPALTREVLRDCGLSAAKEVVPDPHELADRLRRVEVDWSRIECPMQYMYLAAEMAAEKDVLTVVHRRDDARELCAALDTYLGDDSAYHLSALMCPAHRSRVLAEINHRKNQQEPVRLVSTQLVEAGVDLDFPIVYRALAGIDSLAQAAGRCNREGRIESRGHLRVFLAPTQPPEGILQQGLAVTQTMLRAGQVDLFAPSTHARYFERLYGLDEHDAKDIQEHRAKLNFATVAAAYRLIDDDWSAPLVVPYDDDARRAIRTLEQLGPSRARLRALQRFTINIAKRDREEWANSGNVRIVGDGTAYVLQSGAAYDRRFGLVPTRIGALAPTDSIV